MMLAQIDSAPKRLGGVAHGVFRVPPAKAGEPSEQIVTALSFVLELADDVVVEARDEDRSGRGVCWVELRACTRHRVAVDADVTGV